MCLSVRGEDRPSIKHVADEEREHVWDRKERDDVDEMESMLGGRIN